MSVLSKDVDSPSHPLFEVLFGALSNLQIIRIEKDEEEEEEKEEATEEDDIPDGAYIEDGCCLICERELPLTKHHLIPRETHYW